MTNFPEKIWSVNNKNVLVNLAPKLKRYHFHRLSNLELKVQIKDKNFMNFLQLMTCSTFNAQRLRDFVAWNIFRPRWKINKQIKSDQNWTKYWLSFLILLKLYESGTTSILVPNWHRDFCYWLTKSFTENSSSRVTLT